MTGMIGALIYLQKARISPDAAFSVLDWTAYVIFIVVIGGIGTIEGPDRRRDRVLSAAALSRRFRHLVSDPARRAWRSSSCCSRQGDLGSVAERYGMTLFPTRRRLIIRDRGDG